MAKLIVTESQYRRLFETGSNSAAMDLDIYVQPVYHDTSTGNNDLIEVFEEIVSMSNEMKNELEVGKKLKQSEKNSIFKLYDNLKSVYELSKVSQ